jgi:hypothetical protein
MRLQPADDEVEASHLVTAEEAKDKVMNRKLKPMSVFVMIDFFLHHGILTLQNEKSYVELVARTHRTLPFSTTSFD